MEISKNTPEVTYPLTTDELWGLEAGTVVINKSEDEPFLVTDECQIVCLADGVVLYEGWADEDYWRIVTDAKLTYS